MRASACLLVLVIGVFFAQPAAAAMWLRITVDHPVAGAPAAVDVTTFYLTQPLCADDPHASPVITGTWYSGAGAAPSEPPFRLIAYPTGRPDATIVIALRHRAVDSPYFDGTVTFPASGSWVVRMADPHWDEPESETERCGGARIDVQVAPATAQRLGWPWSGAAAAFVVLVAVLLARSRQSVAGLR